MPDSNRENQPLNGSTDKVIDSSDSTPSRDENKFAPSAGYRVPYIPGRRTNLDLGGNRPIPAPTQAPKSDTINTESVTTNTVEARTPYIPGRRTNLDLGGSHATPTLTQTPKSDTINTANAITNTAETRTPYIPGRRTNLDLGGNHTTPAPVTASSKTNITSTNATTGVHAPYIPGHRTNLDLGGSHTTPEPATASSKTNITNTITNTNTTAGVHAPYIPGRRTNLDLGGSHTTPEPTIALSKTNITSTNAASGVHAPYVPGRRTNLDLGINRPAPGTSGSVKTSTPNTNIPPIHTTNAVPAHTPAPVTVSAKNNITTTNTTTSTGVPYVPGRRTNLDLRGTHPASAAPARSPISTANATPVRTSATPITGVTPAHTSATPITSVTPTRTSSTPTTNDTPVRTSAPASNPVTVSAKTINPPINATTGVSAPYVPSHKTNLDLGRIHSTTTTNITPTNNSTSTANTTSARTFITTINSTSVHTTANISAPITSSAESDTPKNLPIHREPEQRSALNSNTTLSETPAMKKSTEITDTVTDKIKKRAEHGYDPYSKEEAEDLNIGSHRPSAPENKVTIPDRPVNIVRGNCDPYVSAPEIDQNLGSYRKGDPSISENRHNDEERKSYSFDDKGLIQPGVTPEQQRMLEGGDTTSKHVPSKTSFSDTVHKNEHKKKKTTKVSSKRTRPNLSQQAPDPEEVAKENARKALLARRVTEYNNIQAYYAYHMSLIEKEQIRLDERMSDPKTSNIEKAHLFEQQSELYEKQQMIFQLQNSLYELVSSKNYNPEQDFSFTPIDGDEENPLLKGNQQTTAEEQWSAILGAKAEKSTKKEKKKKKRKKEETLFEMGKKHEDFMETRRKRIEENKRWKEEWEKYYKTDSFWVRQRYIAAMLFIVGVALVVGIMNLDNIFAWIAQQYENPMTPFVAENLCMKSQYGVEPINKGTVVRTDSHILSDTTNNNIFVFRYGANLRLDKKTELILQHLKTDQKKKEFKGGLSLESGRIFVHSKPDSQVNIVTKEARIYPSRQGESSYSVVVKDPKSSNSRTIVSVYKGSCFVGHTNGSLDTVQLYPGQSLKAYDGRFSALESIKVQDKWIKANTMWDDVANYIDPQKAFQSEPASAEPPQKANEQSKTGKQIKPDKTIDKEKQKTSQRKKK